ncbi:3D domain-containing protein [Paenibacillus sp. FJAT-26967]|uniref:3D domain-containing protein n=1 Tax=Paenibacillus sp. FJAT-26967 TaxID=1729690 RepID=UPI000837F5BD|nr:3D domain-containing protein [Paenibacillus sp. FJAT-26967]
MGNISQQDTHVKRSSSMSFALRWKHVNLRMIILAAIISFALMFMLLVLLYGTAGKSVSLVVNGQETVVETRQGVLQRLLDEQAITIGEHDQVSMPLDGKIKDGQQIVIDHATPVQLTADGQTQTVHTTAKTVEKVLQDSNISLGELDKVTPAKDASLAANTAIEVVRVKKETEDISEPIAFNVVKKTDADLLKGKEQVVQEGKEGLLVKKKEKVFENGKLISEQVVDQAVKNESVDKIVAIGTKNPVVTVAAASEPVKPKTAAKASAASSEMDAKKILKNVTLTAYSSQEPGVGNRTASGTKPTQGRTIAVDTSVIPMGWWVYIEGIGYRRAEDTGGAIKGQKMDVYFDSMSYAKTFGVKRGYTVYVIGPNKPTQD